MKKRILAILIAFAMIIQGIVVCDLSKAYAEDSIYDGGNILAISYDKIAVIDENNTLWMWGKTSNEGKSGEDYIITTPHKVLEDVVSVSVEYGTIAAVKMDGSLWIWGNNGYGQIGDGTKEYRMKPIKVLDDVVSLKSAYGTMAAIKKDGSLWMWGYNNCGQIGDGTSGEDSCRTTPIKVLEDVAYIDFITHHNSMCPIEFITIAVKKDGSVWMWGYNKIGQIVYENRENVLAPVKVYDNANYTSECIGSLMEIKNDGSLLILRDNRDGGLGDRTKENRLTPYRILDNVVSVNNFNDIFGRTTAAVKKDGSLWMWGNNEKGQVGDGMGGRAVVRENPIKILEDVVFVEAYESTIATIKKDGSLWMWGDNWWGQIGDGKGGMNRYRTTPYKVLEDVVYAKYYFGNTVAIKKDGSLWMWGSNLDGQIADVTTEKRLTPAKILDNVISVNVYYGTVVAIKKDGSLWTWGDNEKGQIGDGTTENRPTPYQVPGIKIDPEMLKTSGYTAGENVYTEEVIVPTLPVSEIDNVNSQTTAEDAIKKALAAMTEEEKKTDVGIDTITHYGEVASHLATQKVVSGEIDLIAQIKELETQAMTAKTKTDGLLAGNGVETTRYVRSGVNLNTKENSFKIVVNNETVNSQIDMVRVNSIDYGITVEPKKLKEDVANEELVISVEKILPYNVKEGEIVVSMLGIFSGIYIGNKENVKLALSDDAQSKYKVTFSKETNENITLSLPLTAGDSIYQVIKKDGQAIASKYNPNTKKIEAKINQDGIYTVELNEKNFEDISNKSKEMQEAIKYLASKGIINGKSETTFDPDGEISRAEIAALITRSLSKLDPSVTNTFTDVKAGDWYYVAAISANKAGLFKGNENKQFLPKNKIQKDQLIAVVSRVLVSEMGYKAPTDTTKYVTYVDAPSIQAWAVPEIALAARENLVIKRTDNTFNPTYKMTRGEAAVVLMRMFGKLW